MLNRTRRSEDEIESRRIGATRFFVLRNWRLTHGKA